jgi:hypothetical protein
MEMSPNLNLDNAPLFVYMLSFQKVYLSNVGGSPFMCLTSISIYIDH